MIKKVRAIIVDDEGLARKLIREYLSFHHDIEVTDECENGFEAVKSIGQHKPDLLFLDIQMPRINGFEMLEIMDYRPEIIFTTAYNQYAIRAFEINAVDYLLKPFSRERFDEAIEKALKRIGSKVYTKSGLNNLINYHQESRESLERIVVKSGTKIHVIPCERIHYLEAQDDYVMIYTSEGKFIKQATMKYFEEKLDSSAFLRTHRSFIVQAEQIDRIELYGKESYMLFLKNGQRLPLSKSGYQKLKEKLDF